MKLPTSAVAWPALAALDWAGAGPQGRVPRRA
jgi:hypothetical protein